MDPKRQRVLASIINGSQTSRSWKVSGKKKNAVKLLEDKEMGTLLHNLSVYIYNLLDLCLGVKKIQYRHVHKKWQKGWKEGVNAINFWNVNALQTKFTLRSVEVI